MSISFVKKIITLTGFAFSTLLNAQTLTATEIDALVENTLKSFNVPGIAVGVVKDGKLVHAKGYGVRSIETKEKVDENTLFGIASNSKAYTAAALGMLVDEKKINWDDKVRDYLPEFKLYDPFVTEEFTIRDLLCHRSGLGLGAGDLLMWPDSNKNTKADIIHNLRYLKPVSSFRTKYDYNNNLFIVAGEVIAKVSGLSWEEFIEKKIMKPLKMNSSAACLSRLPNRSNVTLPHAVVDGSLQVVHIDWSETANAAGGIYSNVTDLSKWVIAQLNKGKYGETASEQLFTEKTQQEMWSMQTITPVKNPGPYNTHFAGYGLGWVLTDIKGYKQVSHTGGLAGIVTQVILFPELNLGIIVLTNQQVGAAFVSISNTIKDGYLGMPKRDWVKEYSERITKMNEEAAKTCADIFKEVENQKKNKMAKPDLSLFAGNYSDNWFGKVILTQKNNQLFFQSEKSPRMRGELFYYKANTYVVKWFERAFDADAFVEFKLDKTGKAIGFKMEAFSPMTDFSFDFQDLDFNRSVN